MRLDEWLETFDRTPIVRNNDIGVWSWNGAEGHNELFNLSNFMVSSRDVCGIVYLIPRV